MDKIWANRLIADVNKENGKRLADVPATREVAVVQELKNRLDNGKLDKATYNKIMGIEDGDSADI